MMKLWFFKNPIRHYSSKTTQKWRSVVGLEVHAQIISKSKLFSPSSSAFSSPVNSNVSFLDASLPGTLPVLNKRCVEAGVMTALALNCDVNLVSMFDRKHYFYGDMPAGYQITQQRSPLAQYGNLHFFVYTPGVHKSPYSKEVRIKQLQLEQDSGKSLHDSDRSLIDLNRAGMGLMELVFEPDLTDGEEAAALVKELIAILKRIGTCSCKMEEGALRVDANVSIHREKEPLGVRTEIKNIGSVRGVASAIKYEINRQIEMKERGYDIINETRSWDAISKSTLPLRDKEEKQDYRYMPEPNLPPLYLSFGNLIPGLVNVKSLKEIQPELPAQIRIRLSKELGLTENQALLLVNDDVLLELFEETLKIKSLKPTLLANIIIYEFSKIITDFDKKPQEMTHWIMFLADSVHLLDTRQISRNTVRYLFEVLSKGCNKDALQIVHEQNLFQITDLEELRKLCEEVIKENETLVNTYKAGKKKVFKALMGKIALKTQDRADMAKCDEIMKNLLNKL
ncbi:glutamyl-tRNA(Gln) amidotransferase subunit B, mitochondrial isoform X1 [Harmonia axyridis]|uniref:glutamyl-tRNA(Gln) amidotransferase subunit B, mitochondrial isoform X1 n=1 Tax=Harmonia axyridis TaxID=115357 RepID=UPI001E279176|nr:glutamyl-tRNA(Gln) amidotransferase subunit B, mitochondrial isoform X1 [Harmonia axyridis]